MNLNFSDDDIYGPSYVINSSSFLKTDASLHKRAFNVGPQKHITVYLWIIKDMHVYHYFSGKSEISSLIHKIYQALGNFNKNSWLPAQHALSSSFLIPQWN